MPDPRFKRIECKHYELRVCALTVDRVWCHVM